MSNLQIPIGHFNTQAKDLAREFKLWLSNFEDYLTLVEDKWDPKKKRAMMLTSAGLEVRRIAEGLTLEKDPDE